MKLLILEHSTHTRFYDNQSLEINSKEMEVQETEKSKRRDFEILNKIEQRCSFIGKKEQRLFEEIIWTEGSLDNSKNSSSF